MANAVAIGPRAEAFDNSLDAVMGRHQTRVLRTAYRMLGNWPDAEDVAQEAFIRLYRRGSGFAAEPVLLAWLYRVTINLCIDHRRGAKPRGELLDLTCPQPSPESEAMHGEQNGRLMRALSHLPPKARAAIVLSKIEGLTAAEAAEVLGSSEGTVRSQVSAAMARLREILGGERI